MKSRTPRPASDGPRTKCSTHPETHGQSVRQSPTAYILRDTHGHFLPIDLIVSAFHLRTYTVLILLTPELTEQ